MAESILSQISGDFTLVDSSHSNLNGVIFHHVKTVYTADEAVNCIYSITDAIEPEFGDTIGLFKVGWKSSSECFSSVSAKLPENNQKTFLSTVFRADMIPNESSDLYQFGYISKMRVVGASTPFTFESSDIIAVEDPTDPGLLVFKSRVSQLKDELHKLADEKNYYACKYEILSSNFTKLKFEFDKLEKQLQSEREESNKVSLQLKEDRDQLSSSEDLCESEDSVSKSSEVVEQEDIIDGGAELISEAMNTGVWKSLYEIYEVVTDINLSLKSQHMGMKSNMSYQDLVNYIIEVFTAAKKKFQIKGTGKIDESKYCKCYFQQKAYCCPSQCTEAMFQFMMAQPLYTCFSNFYHYGEDGYIKCDGSFDPTSLSDYVKTMKLIKAQTQNMSEANSEDTGNIGLPETKNEPISDIIDEITNPDSAVIPETKIEPNSSIIDKLIVERDQANHELKSSKEKIATLTSRVNVLELELVNQQSNHIDKPEPPSGTDSQVLISSSSSLTSLDIEGLLESVNNEYISLKDKYNELSKKSAKSDSIEARCAALEEENEKLMKYFTQVLDQNKKSGNATDQFSADLQSLLAEKEKAESKLISLQRESVGKISINLIHQEHQG